MIQRRHHGAMGLTVREKTFLDILLVLLRTAEQRPHQRRDEFMQGVLDEAQRWTEAVCGRLDACHERLRPAGDVPPVPPYHGMSLAEFVEVD